MAKFSILVILAAVCVTAYSLECYQCVNKCDDITKATKIKCDSSNTLKYTCYKKVEKDKMSGAMNTTRGCYIIRDDKDKGYCNVPDPSKAESVFCEGCTEDLCNTATPSFNTNYVTFTVLGVSTIALRYFL
nr:uncharacterized protein LOC111426322 [Onthophagus taurus]